MLFGNSVKEMSIQRNFGNIFYFRPENAKIWQVLSRKRQLRALLMEKIVQPRVSFSQNWSSKRLHFETVGGTLIPEI